MSSITRFGLGVALLCVSAKGFGAQTECTALALIRATQINPLDNALVPPRTAAEMQNIFETTRMNLINEILAGSNAPTPLQSLMINRLKSSRLILKDCPSGAPGKVPSSGASNDLLEDTISVCKTTNTTPEIALVGLFGHEFGHSLDLVQLGCKKFGLVPPASRLESFFRSTSRSKGAPTPGANTIQADSTLSDRLKAPLDLESFLQKLTRISDAQRSFNECAFDTEAERAELAKLLRSNKIRIIDEGIPPQHHPLRPAYSCLTKTALEWPRPPDDQEAAIRGGYSAFGERSAQMWGARAVAIYAQQTPALTQKKTMGLARYFQIYGENSVKRSTKEPELNTVYFSEPAIQRALRCVPAPEQNCMTYLKFGPGSPSPSSTISSPGTTGSSRSNGSH